MDYFDVPLNEIDFNTPGAGSASGIFSFKVNPIIILTSHPVFYVMTYC